jgi:hypothetical protein
MKGRTELWSDGILMYNYTNSSVSMSKNRVSMQGDEG